MKKFFQIVLALSVLAIFSSACANVVGGYIEAEGIVYYEKGMNPNAMRRIAIMDAYRYLAEQVDTLHVNVDSTVRNMRDLDETINVKVEASIRGAQVISSTRQKDGSFRAIGRLNMFGGTQSLAGAVLREDIPVEDFLEPRYVNDRTEINYTGLIIDCRGMNLSPAIAPAIKSLGGLEIYSYKNIGYQKATARGLVEYADNMNPPRAGNSPPVVKAVHQTANILLNCAVVFVR